MDAPKLKHLSWHNRLRALVVLMICPGAVPASDTQAVLAPQEGGPRQVTACTQDKQTQKITSALRPVGQVVGEAVAYLERLSRSAEATDLGESRYQVILMVQGRIDELSWMCTAASTDFSAPIVVEELDRSMSQINRFAWMDLERHDLVCQIGLQLALLELRASATAEAFLARAINREQSPLVRHWRLSAALRLVHLPAVREALQTAVSLNDAELRARVTALSEASVALPATQIDKICEAWGALPLMPHLRYAASVVDYKTNDAAFWVLRCSKSNVQIATQAPEPFYQENSAHALELALCVRWMAERRKPVAGLAGESKVLVDLSSMFPRSFPSPYGSVQQLARFEAWSVTPEVDRAEALWEYLSGLELPRWVTRLD